MGLKKRAKLNMIITILLCMVFVLNIGATLAYTAYTFLAKGVANSSTVEAYTEYAEAKADSDMAIPYIEGSVNVNMGINYGFSSKYDLMVVYQITYKNTSHIANDVVLNFVDRDKWSIAMLSITSITSESIQDLSAQTQYNPSSSTNTFTGVMYYLGSLEGAGRLDIVSGITFNKSSNLTDDYYGDVLTIKFIPFYQKSAVAKYNNLTSTELTNAINNYYTTSTQGGSTHQFYTNGNNYLSATDIQPAYDNWANYMKAYSSGTNYIDQTQFMIYNSHGTDNSAIAFPIDFEYTPNLEEKTEPDRSITAYRYKIVNLDGSYIRNYELLTASNKYDGGLGIMVFPSEQMTLKFTIHTYWEKDGIIQGTSTINNVHLGFSDDIITLSDGLYYNKYITEPTYINILDYIMLTTEGDYVNLWQNGYKLVICNLDVQTITSPPADWSNSTEQNYELHNSTSASPILSRYKDSSVASISKDVKVAVTNNSENTLSINSFTVQGKLWYGDNTNPSTYNQVVSQYLTNTNALNYDETAWNVSFNVENNIYTFTRKTSGVKSYITSGHSLTLISGITIPNYVVDLNSLPSDGVTAIYVYDLWCELEVNITSVSEITSTDDFNDSGEYSGVEIITSAYNSTMSANEQQYIYLRNNTNQIITSVNISNLTLAEVISTNGNPRDVNNFDSSSNFNYSITSLLDNTTSTQSSTTAFNKSVATYIYPNEQVAIVQIQPSENAIIYNYNITVTLAGGYVDNDVQAMHYANGNMAVINLSNKAYEFRLKSSLDINNILTNVNDFVIEQKDGYYYAYYKGVIYSGQYLNVCNLDLSSSVTIEIIEHSLNTDGDTQYVSTNYTSWNPPQDWLTAMQTIFGSIDKDDIINAN